MKSFSYIVKIDVMDELSLLISLRENFLNLIKYTGTYLRIRTDQRLIPIIQMLFVKCLRYSQKLFRYNIYLTIHIEYQAINLVVSHWRCCLHTFVLSKADRSIFKHFKYVFLKMLFRCIFAISASKIVVRIPNITTVNEDQNVASKLIHQRVVYGHMLAALCESSMCLQLCVSVLCNDETEECSPGFTVAGLGHG